MRGGDLARILVPSNLSTGNLCRHCPAAEAPAEVRLKLSTARTMKILASTLLAAVLSTLALGAAEAQDWPVQPVHMIVPFSAGGPSDLTARIVSDEMSRQLNQPVLVENRSGAGSTLGTGVVARAPKDGHTILFTTSSLGYMKSLVLKMSFDPETDLEPVALIGTTSYILVANNDFPARNLRDVVALVRDKPGAFNYGSAGIGSAMHFMFEHFSSTAGGLSVTHVPYRGGGAVMTDLIGGQVQLATDPSSSTMPYIAKGSVRPIAVTSRNRLPTLPDVPTFRESGLPGFESFEAYGWYMALVPSGTPAPVVSRINTALRNAIATPSVQKRFAEMNIEAPVENSPEATARFLKREFGTWAAVAQRSGIKPE
jgi:tripartite-type tricarboxylate transporter receptor subunit TctC